MKSFMEAIKGHIVLFDGAMGTMISKFSGEGACPELLCVSHPSEITAVHRQYVEAGSELVTTNTFGASAIKLKKHGAQASMEELNLRAVECARASGAAYIAGSMGPTGDFLAPYGSLTLNELIGNYAAQAAVLEMAGADIILIETMMDLAEARAAAIGAKSATKLPVIISFTFEQGGRTLMGNPPQALANMAFSVGADAVGVNCSGGPETLLHAVREMASFSSLPVIAQPNAGLPTLKGGRETYELEPEDMAKGMAAILDAGVAAIGGCCGTTPEHIKHMVTLVKNRTAPSPAGSGQFISSARELVPLDVFSGVTFRTVYEETSIYDMEDDLPTAAFDFTYLDVETALLKLEEIQAITSKPLAMKLSGEQCLPLLTAYHGVAAVKCEDDTALRQAFSVCKGHHF